MVGRKEGSGDICEDMQILRDVSAGAGVLTERIGIPWCCDQVLASGARPFEGHACDCFAGEAISAYELDDTWRSCAVLMVCQKDAPSGQVLHYRMVYGIAAQRDCLPLMVDDQPGNGTDEKETR